MLHFQNPAGTLNKRCSTCVCFFFVFLLWPPIDLHIHTCVGGHMGVGVFVLLIRSTMSYYRQLWNIYWTLFALSSSRSSRRHRRNGQRQETAVSLGIVMVIIINDKDTPRQPIRAGCQRISKYGTTGKIKTFAEGRATSDDNQISIIAWLRSECDLFISCPSVPDIDVSFHCDHICGRVSHSVQRHVRAYVLFRGIFHRTLMNCCR